jgi:riboflavin kinase / FMN adenylyltransferase
MYYDLARASQRPLVVAIGFFDGFHCGHREIARQTMRMRRPGFRSGVVTFAAHPAAFLRPGKEPPLLTTPSERVDLLAQAGFEECFLVAFDDSIARLTPQEFLKRLVDGLSVRGVAVGSTFRFGHRRAGDVPFMQEYLTARGVAFAPVQNVTDGGVRISSTLIRGLVSGGELAAADRLLGPPGYELRGAVELGAGRGHGIGFPTANVRAPEKLLPKDGIYSALARYDGRDYAALVSIGTNPQFDGMQRTVEAWLRDFQHTIYGREIALRDLRFLRNQMRFPSVDELVDQMHRDMEAVAFPSYG